MGNHDVNNDNEGEIVFRDFYWLSRGKGVDIAKGWQSIATCSNMVGIV